MPQRAYPRLFTNNVMELQRIINQMCDWIFATGASPTATSTGVGTAIQVFMPTPDLQLGLSASQIPGTEITLSPGKWLVVGLFFFSFNTPNGFCYGGLTIDGSPDPHLVEVGSTGPVAAERFSPERTWLVDSPNGGIVNLFAGHNNLSAGAFIIAGQTSILAVRIA